MNDKDLTTMRGWVVKIRELEARLEAYECLQTESQKAFRDLQEDLQAAGERANLEIAARLAAEAELARIKSHQKTQYDAEARAAAAEAKLAAIARVRIEFPVFSPSWEAGFKDAMRLVLAIIDGTEP